MTQDEQKTAEGVAAPRRACQENARGAPEKTGSGGSSERGPQPDSSGAPSPGRRPTVAEAQRLVFDVDLALARLNEAARVARFAGISVEFDASTMRWVTVDSPGVQEVTVSCVIDPNRLLPEHSATHRDPVMSSGFADELAAQGRVHLDRDGENPSTLGRLPDESRGGCGERR